MRSSALEKDIFGTCLSIFTGWHPLYSLHSFLLSPQPQVGLPFLCGQVNILLLLFKVSCSDFHHDWLVTMLGVVGSIKAGPILEYPLIEKNLQRDVRPIVTKVRKVRGKRGWFLRRLGRFFGAPRTPEGLGHHALQVGDYAYELHTDEANQKYLIVQRLTGEQIWMSTVKHEVVGYTDFSDEDIQLTCRFSEIPQY